MDAWNRIVKHAHVLRLFCVRYAPFLSNSPLSNRMQVIINKDTAFLSLFKLNWIEKCQMVCYAPQKFRFVYEWWKWLDCWKFIDLPFIVKGFGMCACSFSLSLCTKYENGVRLNSNVRLDMKTTIKNTCYVHSPFLSRLDAHINFFSSPL